MVGECGRFFFTSCERRERTSVLKYLREVRKEDRKLGEIPPQELNLFLSEFITAARMKKGEQYQKNLNFR